MIGASLIEGQINGFMHAHGLPTIEESKPIAAKIEQGFKDLEGAVDLPAVHDALDKAGSAAEVLEKELMGDVLADGKVTAAELAAAFEKPDTQVAIANLLVGIKELKGAVDLKKADTALGEIKAGFAQVEALKAKK